MKSTNNYDNCKSQVHTKKISDIRVFEEVHFILLVKFDVDLLLEVENDLFREHFYLDKVSY